MYLNILEAESILGYKIGISVFKEKSGREIIRFADLIQMIYMLSFTFLIGALIGCLYYVLVIWYKDFFNKTKPIYTLFMLPENKFIIFI